MSKLKKCPFCNKRPEVIEIKLWSERGCGYYGKFSYHIACVNPKCKVKPETQIMHNTIYDGTKEMCIEKAVKDWNERGNVRN